MGESEPKRPRALRPFWSGVLTFGLVSVPVELFTAVRSQRTSLRMVGPDGRPVKRRYVSSTDGEPVEQPVRGVEIDGKWVTVSDEELQGLEPEKTREIDLRRFVPEGAIDPVYCDRPYLLLPDGEVTKAYRLLAHVMEETGRAGVASFVLRGRESLVAIFADQGVLRAETLRHADEVRSAATVGLPKPGKVSKERKKAFADAIEALSEKELAMEDLADTDARLLSELVEGQPKKARVKVADEVHEEDSNVVDILEVLKERLGVKKAS